MANPIQQGLKRESFVAFEALGDAAMANPIQQGLKPDSRIQCPGRDHAAMANPIQQGLKQTAYGPALNDAGEPQWLIQYNKD